MAVSLITVHHEGAGVPVDWARGGEGGYSIWIGDVNGDGVYDVLRSPFISWATLNFNHVSLDLCLSGDRDVVPTTPQDVATIGRAVAQARAMGWVIDHPLVRSHHDSPGSSTVCPGTHTRDPAVWSSIVAACIGVTNPSGPPPPPAPSPNGHPTIQQGAVGGEVAELQHDLNIVAAQGLKEDGNFGPATTQAVKNFQTVLKLAVDGVAGPATWNALIWIMAAHHLT